MISNRKHTPIVSRQQQKLFGFWKSHPSKKPSSITMGEIDKHLEESRGKDLPKRMHSIMSKKKRKK